MISTNKMKINQPKFTGTEIDVMLNPATVLNAVEDLRRQRASMSPNNLASAVKKSAGLEVYSQTKVNIQ